LEEQLNLVTKDRANESSLKQIDLQFLKFQLQPNFTTLIEVELVTELVNVFVDRVVPMPHLPPTVLGVYNWRGEILWIVDLAMLIGVTESPRRYQNPQPTIILSSGNNNKDRQQKTIGFVVDEIGEIESGQLELIKSTDSDNIYPELSNWTRGWWESATGENFLVLDGHAILNRTDFHADL
jgi:positive phototaxis protein PixI